tara:strand:- start:5374 stop:5748 length:375 start_codon:yes stop_codon:yes gene_type:complete
MSNAIINILNIKLSSIVNDLLLDNNELDFENIYKFLKKKKYFKIDKKYFCNNIDNSDEMNDSKIIRNELLDYLKNDPKFLIYNNCLDDVRKVLIKEAEYKKISSDFITLDYVNDIIISYINSYI